MSRLPCQPGRDLRLVCPGKRLYGAGPMEPTTHTPDPPPPRRLHKKQVAEASLAALARHAHRWPPGYHPALVNGRRLPPPDHRRCCAVNRGDGERCRAWAMRGATRCPMHGGRAQVAKRYGKAALRPRSRARLERNEAKRAIRRAVGADIRDAPPDLRRHPAWLAAERSGDGSCAIRAGLVRAWRAMHEDGDAALWRDAVRALDAVRGRGRGRDTGTRGGNYAG